MISQRNRGQFIRSTAIARKINRKIGFSLFSTHRKEYKSIILH